MYICVQVESWTCHDVSVFKRVEALNIVEDRILPAGRRVESLREQNLDVFHCRSLSPKLNEDAAKTIEALAD